MSRYRQGQEAQIVAGVAAKRGHYGWESPDLLLMSWLSGPGVSAPGAGHGIVSGMLSVLGGHGGRSVDAMRAGEADTGVPEAVLRR